MANQKELPSGKVTEIIVRIDGHPVYSGTVLGARVAVHNAVSRAIGEGRAEPDVKVTQRTVDYDLADNDPKKVTETELTEI